MNRYYFGSITECANGYEFTSNFLFSTREGQDLEDVTTTIQDEYRGECDDIEQKPMHYYEITEEEFNVMMNHLSVL